MTLHSDIQHNIRILYNITLPIVQKTGRKSCCIRIQIIGITMVSKHNFDDVTCALSYFIYDVSYGLP